ncbi:MAG: glycosyltransferase family 39 protein [Patescibacteria group bacterium]
MLNKKILLIFFFAFVIRLIVLNQSLWLDEAVTANVVRNFRFSQIVSGFSPTDFHPPLYYLFMKLWTNVFGYSEIALRMPSVIFSLLTGYVVYLIAGIWGAVLFLFNPLIVYYSQEARMYMMTTFLLTVALYYFLKNKNVILFNLFIFLSLLTFYGSIFLITAFLVFYLYKKQYRNLFICLLVVFVYFLTISPLLYQQFINSKIALNNVLNWSAVLGKANIKNLLLIPIKFSIGRISFYPKWLYWGIAGGWTGFVLFSIKTVLNKTVFIKTVLYLLIFPLILGFLVSFFAPMLQYFRFLYLVPIVCILLGFGLSGQAKINRRGYVLVGGFLIFSLTYLLFPQFHREDWKSLVKNLPKNKPIYMIEASSDPVKYYDNKLTIKELRMTDYGLKEKEIVVIPYIVDIYGYDYKKKLKEKGYLLNKTNSFRGLFFEEWKSP